MGPITSGSKAKKLAAGPELAALLPQDPKPWYLTRHLLMLNLVLMVPLFSTASIGYDGSMMNGLQSLLIWRAYFKHPTASILGTMNAVYPIGKFFGVFFTAWMGDRYGRKLPMCIGFLLLILGAGLQGGAKNVAMFIIARLILGFGTAFVAQPSPILIAELAYPLHRGRITAIYYSTYYVGGIIAAWGTYGTSHLHTQYSWRIPSYIQGALPVIQLLFLYFVPESPRWLIAKGRHAEAHAILSKYHAGGDTASPLVAFELAEMEGSIQTERTVTSETNYLDLFRTAPNRRRTLIAMIVGFYGTWSGIAIIAYYLTLVLDTIGITDTSSQVLINGLTQVFNLLMSITSALLIDRIGRRPLWLVAVAGMLCSYIAWTALSASFAHTHDAATGRAVLGFIFLYKLFYDGSFSPMLLAYPIEIFPYTLRGRGVTVSIATNQVALIVSQFVNPVALTRIGWRYYIVFCVLLAVFWGLVWFLFPETKGRSLEEIAEVFDGRGISVGSWRRTGMRRRRRRVGRGWSLGRRL
ncbi:lactose permease [Mytilinidion resinicola]|uniref:Lactose permease n=1 Tax=Mytilinidion resinicola TaxID=574789 RepID=A0A6A6YN06_9PEZI|nr:lactose permease [Mytilinidion resinicola]KAF2809384.1 lactose permease [Mytilinidion resinicola]